MDCPDGRDEEDCDCHPVEFRCSNGRCIPRGFLCDRSDDCGDNSDESSIQCGPLPATHATRAHCGPNKFMCGNQQCVSLGVLCNNRTDCADGSDEGDHCTRDECKNSPCHHNCHESPNGYRCSCKPGFQLAGDHHSCEDIDECASPSAPCDHYCRNTIGSYVCSCEVSYKPDADSHHCTIDEDKLVLLFVDGQRLRAVVGSHSHITSDVTSTEDISTIDGLAFDSSLKTVYWSTTTGIWKVSVEGHVARSDTRSVSTKLRLPSHLSMDWSTHNLYIVDERHKLVVCNANISRCVALNVPDELNEIKSLTLAINEG